MILKMLFYRYGSICEPDAEAAFAGYGLEVCSISREVTDKTISSKQRIALISEKFDRERPVFIFSIDYFPDIARVCRIYSVPYISYVVDSPLPELFSDTVCYDINRIFLFDRAQYEMLQGFNPDHIFYLPLATDPARWDMLLAGNSSAGCEHDVSFVGSLYNEKNPYARIKDRLPAYTRGYIDGVVSSMMQLPGINLAEEVIDDEITAEIKKADPDFWEIKDAVTGTDRYIAAQCYIGFEEAVHERCRTLTLLSEHFDTTVYTRSDISELREQAPGLHFRDGVKTLTEMPLVFHGSRINMNITMKPIKTGLSLRAFDICGCGGFLMTNWQQEFSEYFEPGIEAECYSSFDELIQKTDFYLKNEEIRCRIARAGYERVKREHTWAQRIAQILKCASGT